MTTLTVHIKDEKSEKAVKAALEALGVSYEVAASPTKASLNKAERIMLERLKGSFEEIGLDQSGKKQLPDARELLNEL